MNPGQIDNISQNGDAHKITSLYMSIYTGFYRSKKCNLSFGPEYICHKYLYMWVEGTLVSDTSHRPG